VRARIVRTGFDQWFSQGANAGAASPPGWKQNMLVLLQLYPVVFLFGLLVQGPVLTNMLHMPFWLSLFVSNVASVILLSWLVPWTVARFGWWLRPAAQDAAPDDRLGAGLIAALYAVAMLVFSQV
jgi:antibiotic biosynthesis monooxygenase (ABM) superfamily enzyme